jgi:hypothetical protein
MTYGAKAITLASKMAFEHFVVDRVDCNVGDGDDNFMRAGRDDIDGNWVVRAHPATQCQGMRNAQLI